MSPEREQILLAQLGEVLHRHVEPIFKPGARITLLVRFAGDPESDVLVSSDDEAGVRASVERAYARPQIQATIVARDG